MSEISKDSGEPHIIPMKSTGTEPTPVLGTPGYHTIPVDKIMAYTDTNTGIATLTLFSMHVVPDVDSKNMWSAKQTIWEPVGEIKVPIPVLNAFFIYHMYTVTDGLDILPLLAKWAKEHPQVKGRPSTYGPARLTYPMEKPDEK